VKIEVTGVKGLGGKGVKVKRVKGLEGNFRSLGEEGLRLKGLGTLSSSLHTHLRSWDKRNYLCVSTYTYIYIYNVFKKHTNQSALWVPEISTCI
jgi:hypothetical protein